MMDSRHSSNESDAEGVVLLDDLHVGLTRRANYRGVPIMPLMYGAMAVAAIYAGSGKLLTLPLIFPVFAILILVGANNPRIFAEIAAWVRVNMRCNNRLFWGVASFSPRRTKKWGNRA